MSDRKTTQKLHPKAEEALDLMERGRLSRRGFIRVAALVGVSAGAAYAMAGLPSPAHAQMMMPFPDDDPNAKEGGILKVAMQIQKMEDPATYSWVEMSNQTRHTLEHLAMTGPDNITRPMLAESWKASDDLKTWTFNLRKGVMWHNGEELVADHIKFNVERWTDAALGSSNVGLSSISALVEEVDSGEKNDDGTAKMTKQLIAGAIDIVDSHTIRFNLTKAVLSFPEDMYNYPTAIVHPSFTAPFSANPVGTGPFGLAELVVGEKAILKKVTETSDGKAFSYWGGKTYLDEIHYYNFDEDNQLTAFAGGDVDTIYEFGIEQYDFAEALDGKVLQARTAQNLCCRFQISKEPFTDKRVRQAIVKGIDNAAVKALVFPDGGDIGENHHVAPIHPEYFPLPALERDVEGAKALLKEAGKEGLKVTIDVGNTDGPWHQTVCEAMREQLKDIGVELSINVMPPSKYWEVWATTAFGATAWTHRPLGTMVLSLGYRTGVPWNETHYANKEWDAALDAAEATLDVEARRAKMEIVQKMMQDDAIMVMPIWRPIFTITRENIQGLALHPTNYHQFNKVWLS